MISRSFTARVYVVYIEFTSGSPAPEPGGRTAPGPQVVPHRHIPEAGQGLVECTFGPDKDMTFGKARSRCWVSTSAFIWLSWHRFRIGNGYGSGSRSMEIDQNLQINLVSCLSKRLCTSTFVGIYLELLGYYLPTLRI